MGLITAVRAQMPVGDSSQQTVTPDTRADLRQPAAAMAPVFAGYQRENKRHATIAIGCTGGKHRSVAVAEELATLLRSLPGVAVSVKHRDLGRE